MAKADLRKPENAATWLEIGQAMDRVRCARRLSVKEFAEKVSRDEAQVRRWFGGTERPQAEARKCQRVTQDEHDERQNVYEYSMVAGRHCGMCGEHAVQDDGTPHVCANGDKATDVGFCDHCGAELMDNDTCDNDHDEWAVDVHCTEHEVRA